MVWYEALLSMSLLGFGMGTMLAGGLSNMQGFAASIALYTDMIINNLWTVLEESEEDFYIYEY